MDKNERPLRVLWFANTPGLSQQYFNAKVSGGGWISSLQREVENTPGCQLGFAFYHDSRLEPFEFKKTTYFPIQKMASSKRKRLLYRLAARTEKDENLANFLEVIESFRPDIIHVHGTENSFGLILRHIRHIPVVVSIQGNLTVYTKKYFSGMNMPGLVTQAKAGYPFFGSDYKIWTKRAEIEQEILRAAKYIFGRTDWDRRVAAVLAPGARYFPVEEVMREKFYRIQWQPGSNAVPVLFTTSSPSFYKGFEMVIDTAILLVKNNFSFAWLVAGLSEEDALVKLTLRMRGISSLAGLHIQLLGQRSEDGLAEDLLRSDVYVQVSHIENSPNSLCEAMLAGIPVIASFAGGTSSLLRDGREGILVQDGDPYALAGGLLEMIRTPGPSRQMAGAARQVAHKRHDPGAIVDGMLKAYAVIIHQHAREAEGGK